ncbi:hypothetical protein ASPBRDRAFT_580777 [Aspergillus brasiliensis CBS 101740]|uniref:Uncharacterized protein n=1 Tax=Aspergillus brasiliensis (strain CBS 101740 / IMI 381727 / IBT 21946) TaxID=767769 RepID=A0A1L9UK01_ASPBC|nr:hypothetical protein ASPBRDRAFT_580777 [Aspergillus brasiliensis CBS 101740]
MFRVPLFPFPLPTHIERTLIMSCTLCCSLHSSFFFYLACCLHLFHLNPGGVLKVKPHFCLLSFYFLFSHYVAIPKEQNFQAPPIPHVRFETPC